MSRTAFLTGAASGIGAATARALYDRGWTLGLADLNQQALQELSAGWDSSRVRCYALDVTDAAAFARTIGHFTDFTAGSLQLLFNCAGILHIDHFEAIPASRHQQIIDINVSGVINGCLAAFPWLKNTPAATVINMSSASAVYGIPRMASYSASKFAVSGLTEALQIEWQPHGIRVCDVIPPFVSTPMLNNQTSGAPVLDRLGVHLQAEDVAAAVIRQLEAPRTHRAVSTFFAVAWMLSQITPRAVTRRVIQFLNR